ncbi:MAG: hypothetical protein A2W02_01210 [Alphaproteobacteria bacterium RBG_16_64_48]|nr:MAG: hypothetical protein A2W02_01210 [Alphaproteobacteria bacterium RBG_16_64_48]
MNDDVRAQSLDQLRWSLQALALPSDAQRSLFPPFACTADELALDFDHWSETAKQQQTFTTEQLAALASVSALLSAMSGENDAGLWTNSALGLPRWQKVRERARKALETFRWSLDTPPLGRAIFVRSKPGPS